MPRDHMQSSMDLLRKQGIAGVECYTQSHNEKITSQCVDWCKRHNLLIHGESDDHGGYANRVFSHAFLDHQKELDLGPILPDIYQK